MVQRPGRIEARPQREGRGRQDEDHQNEATREAVSHLHDGGAPARMLLHELHEPAHPCLLPCPFHADLDAGGEIQRAGVDGVSGSDRHGP